MTVPDASSTPSTPPSGDDRLAAARRFLREWRKQQRLARLARGLAYPRTRAELRAFLDGVQRRLGHGNEGEREGGGE